MARVNGRIGRSTTAPDSLHTTRPRVVPVNGSLTIFSEVNAGVKRVGTFGRNLPFRSMPRCGMLGIVDTCFLGMYLGQDVIGIVPQFSRARHRSSAGHVVPARPFPAKREGASGGEIAGHGTSQGWMPPSGERRRTMARIVLGLASSHAEAVQHIDLEVIDYVPCYRSPAGMGCAMGFAGGHRRPWRNRVKGP
jgi:hypothetical protein